MHKRIITIAGNMGVGKTALTEMLSKELGWPSFFEAVDENPYLSDFYTDMQKWGFHSQLFFLTRRLELYKDMMADSAEIVLQDRGIFEDAEVFTKNLYNQGSINDRDYLMYHDLYRQCMKLMPLPGLVVYLKASVPTLMKRIQGRGRAYEQDISEDYLAQLNALYDALIENFTHSPTLTISVDDIDFVNQEKDFESIRKAIWKELNQQKQLDF